MLMGTATLAAGAKYWELCSSWNMATEEFVVVFAPAGG